MKRFIKFFVGLVIILICLSFFQYRNDYKRALYYNNLSVVTYAQYLRLDEGSKTLKKYYIPEYKKNVTNAKNFALDNIGHYEDLFKGTDISKFSTDEMRRLRGFESKSISNQAMKRWRDIDPDRRAVVYYNYLDIPVSGVLTYFEDIYNNPLAYSHTYSHKGAFTDKYMLKNMDKKDVLGEYIDDGGYSGDDEQIDEDSVTASDDTDTQATSEKSDFEKLSPKQKKIDNKFREKLDNTVGEINSLTGLDYDYGQQGLVRLPSNYPKKTKTYEITLGARHNKEGEDITGSGPQNIGRDMPPVYTVKLKYDTKNKEFKITNLDDMPQGFVEQ